MPTRLQETVDQIAAEAGAEAVAVAYHDAATGTSWSLRGDRWFHAASTFKVAVLVALFAAIEEGRFRLEDRLHVRNRFLDAVDGTAFSIASSRDADGEVHGAIGKLLRIRKLAESMIATSSNLATNLLIDAVGLDRVQRTLAELGVEGVELRRGVEDERAYEEGIINRVTANGLVQVLRLIEEKQAISAEACERMLEILHDQEFRSGIPAGLPDDARVANKTGEISTVAHDTGLVYLKEREPYALAILTEWEASKTGGRRDTLAKISRAVYEHLVGRGTHG